MEPVSTSLEKILQSHLSECLKEALTKFVGNTYGDNPVLRIFSSVVDENSDSIRNVFNDVLKETFSSEEFKAELRQQAMKKIAQTIVGQTSGLAEKQINQLKQDPVFKANMTLLISESLKP